MSNIREREIDATGEVIEKVKNLRYKKGDLYNKKETHEAINYIEENYPETQSFFTICF